ncbi:MAG: hypothetical protein GX575_33320 [Candidatus Anammoximicrobium sp.]|nr:hypothetical protein [Candidatus Anammoximicrobium sp.]
MAHVNRLLAQAGPDCTRLFCIALARSIVDDNPGNLAALASLQESERWLAEREAAEPGFTNRVKSELRRLGLLKTGDVAMVRPAGIAST